MMVTGTLFTVWLRVIHNIRHANFLVLALLGTLRDRAHPKSMFQNQVLGERVCRCGDLPPRGLAVFSAPRDGVHLYQARGSELRCCHAARRAAQGLNLTRGQELSSSALGAHEERDPAHLGGLLEGRFPGVSAFWGEECACPSLYKVWREEVTGLWDEIFQEGQRYLG